MRQITHGARRAASRGVLNAHRAGCRLCGMRRVRNLPSHLRGSYRLPLQSPSVVYLDLAHDSLVMPPPDLSAALTVLAQRDRLPAAWRTCAGPAYLQAGTCPAVTQPRAGLPHCICGLGCSGLVLALPARGLNPQALMRHADSHARLQGHHDHVLFSPADDSAHI